jgi:hypothetical protein
MAVDQAKLQQTQALAMAKMDQNVMKMAQQGGRNARQT